MTMLSTDAVMDTHFQETRDVSVKMMEHGLELNQHAITMINMIMIMAMMDMVIVIMVVTTARKTIRLLIQYMYEHYHHNFSLQYSQADHNKFTSLLKYFIH